MKSIKEIIMFCFIVVIPFTVDQAQQIENPNIPFWVNAGLGASSAGISVGGSLNFPLNESSLITLRYCWNEEFAIFTNGANVWDAAVMYGIKTNNESFHASISSGISFVGGVNLGKYISGKNWFGGSYQEIEYLTIGLPIDAQLFYRPLNFIGLGINFTANINSEKTYGGVNFCLQLGSFN